MKKTNYDDMAQADLCAKLASWYQTDVVTTKQVSEYTKGNNLPWPYFLQGEKHKIGWGKYRVAFGAAVVPDLTPTVKQAVEVELIKSEVKTLDDDFIPKAEPGYVPFGFFTDLLGIIQSKIFYPVYITGLSGNGKTYMVDQVCAKAQRELIRVNITKETDEHDLIGTYELVDGNTVWRDGPVVIAMKRGAVLLLDETDYGSERLLCLQPVLEGKGYFNKKKGEFITPATGFNIIATANTKGKGSDDGRFIGANVLNEAFLERFAITVEQEYPNEATERSILDKLFSQLITTPGMNVKEFASNLSKWAELLRKSHAEGTIDEVISTRRLTHIARAYAIFKNRRKAIELCLNRFDTETKTVYLDFYSKIDMNLDKPLVDEPELVIPGAKTQSPFKVSVQSTNTPPDATLVEARKAAQAAQAKLDAVKAAQAAQAAQAHLDAVKAAAAATAAVQAASVQAIQAERSAAQKPAPTATPGLGKPVTDPKLVNDIMTVSAAARTVIKVRQADNGDFIVTSHNKSTLIRVALVNNKSNLIRVADLKHSTFASLLAAAVAANAR